MENQFEHQIVIKGQKKLRRGFTTGTCAALASKAATVCLLTGQKLNTVNLITPKGIKIEVEIIWDKVSFCENQAIKCGVKKDSGDDPDVTDGALVYAEVSKNQTPGVTIDGGNGVGRVTKPGLEQPVGAAAINKVPRQMIKQAVEEICNIYEYNQGISVTIHVPEGDKIAQRTFNPHLGIQGGISILGTSGIVEPMSNKALLNSIKVQMQMLKANSEEKIIITPGNYGENFIKNSTVISQSSIVKCSNFIGDTLDYSVSYEFKEILIVGHIGKLVKLSGGILNTHSSVADGRMEMLALHSALCGLNSSEMLNNILSCVAVDDALEVIQNAGMLVEVMDSVLKRSMHYVKRRLRDSLSFGMVMFSNKFGILASNTENITIDLFDNI